MCFDNLGVIFRLIFEKYQDVYSIICKLHGVFKYLPEDDL